MDVYWAGTIGAEGGSYACSHGSAPGVASIQCKATFAPGGPAIAGVFAMSDGLGGVLQLPDCKLQSIGFAAGPSGLVANLTILDRRYKWRFATISGVYNQKDQKGQVAKWTEKKPVELVKLCLEAMGEKSSSIVIGLPNDARPEVNWDYANAAQALEAIIDPLGCRLVFDYATQLVAVVPAGVGSALPNGHIAEDSVGANVPNVPDTIEIVGAPARYQLRIPLRAVGRDFDGQWKPIDDLSYAPSQGQGGWSKSTPPSFPNVVATSKHTIEEAEALAKQFVYRAYQVDVERYPITPPGRKTKVSKPKDVVLTAQKVTTKTDADGNPTELPAIALGTHWPGGMGWKNSGEYAVVKTQFQVDDQNGIIVFDRPVFLLADDGSGVQEANLYYEGGVMIRDEKTHQVVRWTKKYATGSKLSTKPLSILHEDIRYGIEQLYLDNGHEKSTLDNAKDCEKIAGYYFKGAVVGLAAGESADRTYNGLTAVGMDGKTQQVSMSVGSGGAETRASQNTEHVPYIPKYPERRRREAELTKVGDDAARAQRQALAKARILAYTGRT